MPQKNHKQLKLHHIETNSIKMCRVEVMQKILHAYFKTLFTMCVCVCV